jgi:hypothetical protein
MSSVKWRRLAEVEKSAYPPAGTGKLPSNPDLVGFEADADLEITVHLADLIARSTVENGFTY